MVAGASGLVGTALVRLLLESPQYDQVHILVRKEMMQQHPKLVQHVVDFELLAEQTLDFTAEDAFCALGTTIAKAGSRPAFIRVDHDYVVAFAEKSLELGATGLFVVSSMGANARSMAFYNRVKGQMEEVVKKMKFPRMGIFRPSLLLGNRMEKRTGEQIAAWVMRRLDFMFPVKYKAIPADKVAARMVELALRSEPGLFVLESDEIW